MSTQAGKVTIVAPFFLLPEISAALERAVETREARRAGRLIVSAEIDPDAGETMIVAPALEHVLRWAQRFSQKPLTRASLVLAKFADITERGGVAVIRENDLPSCVADIVQRFGGNPADSGGEFWARKQQRIMDAEESIDVQALQIYENLPLRAGASSWWSYRLFDTPKGRCAPTIDIMGRPRVLCFGPYFALTRGEWRADVSFSLSDDAVPYDYLVEFGTLEDFSRTLFRAEREGPQTLSLRYSAQETISAELRISILRAAFHGNISLVGAQITRLEPSLAVRPRESLSSAHREAHKLDTA